MPPHQQSVPFNTAKSETLDRLIFDRRGQNGCETRFLAGPSTGIVAGARFADLCLSRHCETLRLSCLDRKDMYYQTAVSEARSNTNVIGPPWPAARFQNEFPEIFRRLPPPASQVSH